MRWTRAAMLAVIAACAALIFGWLSPGESASLTAWTDRYLPWRWTAHQLHWASLGGSVWGLGSYIMGRCARSARWGAFTATAAGTVVVTWAVLKWPSDVDRLASTIFSVVLAISIIGSVWVFLNVLIENARKDWAIFSGVASAIVASVAFAIMRGNLSLKSLLVEEDLALFGAGAGFWGHLEWPLFGGIAWGVGVFVMRRFNDRRIRVAIGIVLGTLTGWQIGVNSLLWQRPAISWVSAALWTALFAALGGAWRLRRDGTAIEPSEVPVIGSLHRLQKQITDSATKPEVGRRALPGALSGAIVGFTFATWFRADFFGSGTDVVLAAAIPLAALGARIAWNDDPGPTQLAAFENRAHAWIFLGPALLFLTSALVIPTVRTIILSTLDRNYDSTNFTGNTFDGFNAEGDAYIGLDNYRELLNDPDTFDLSRWSDLFTSDLFRVALVLLLAGTLAGLISGTKQNGTTSYVGTGSSIGSLALGGLLLSFAVLSVLRGTFFNNLWWVITVTSLSVVLGLTIAVLAERAGRYESIAKSLIFMPMAISFVGASVVWRLQYQPRDKTKPQTGVLNALWVELGKLSHSSWPRMLVLVLLGSLLLWVFSIGARRAVRGEVFGAHVGLSIVIGHLFVELTRRSLGGFRFGPDDEILPETVVFLQEARPFNNVFLMVILIWIQTGFAMVILSASIKAVPPELLEAAKVDGATESQSFFQVVLPQILPTIGVVTTTLIVLVTKVFDIVKVGTGGNYGTNVLANDMYEVSFSFGNFTLGSAIAVFILISVLPVMYLNVRRMQKARA